MTTDDCGSKLSAVEQVQRISTPEYPQRYSYNLTCTWRITANRDYLIRLETGFVSNDTCCEHLEVSSFGRKKFRWVKITVFPSRNLISLLSFRSHRQQDCFFLLIKFISVLVHQLHLVLFPTAAWLEVDLKCNIKQV